MSRSNPTQTNPAQHFYRWSGSKGNLTYWDKEKSEEVVVSLPFEFMVLDELSTVKGYSDQDESGFWSNEVRSIGRDEITVKTSKGTRGVGLYRDLKAQLSGLKYSASVYIAHKLDGEYILGNIQMTGAALGSWMDFCKAHKVQNGTVSITGCVEGKKGATVFQIPTFEYRSSTDEEDEKAKAIDKDLQVYLSQYLAHTDLSKPVDPEYTQEEVDSMVGAAVGAAVDGKEPINLDDIPF